ncbi:MAG: hypothetical protein Q6373_002135 [Candidatus Sigynarchaeota archaeon]
MAIELIKTIEPEPEFVEQDPGVDLPEPADPRDPLDDPIPRRRK